MRAWHLTDLDGNNTTEKINPSLEFIHQERWNPNYVFAASTQVGNEKVLTEEDYFDSKWINGTINLANYGCGISILLVVNGKEHGHVWVDDRCNDQGIFPHSTEEMNRVRFVQWYELWLDEYISKMNNND
jgi:hypothetical protein